MQKVFERPKSLKALSFSYCSGCGHSIVHRLIAEVIDEMDIAEKKIAIAPVGCAVASYEYFNIDFSESAHGRAAAVATGVKRVLPDNIVFTYQGDGDLAAIGLAETLHAANRGENITVIFINNTVYGMTGGQMAPTTMVGQKTITCPAGRMVSSEGYPIKVAEMIANLEAPVYVVRTSVHDVPNIKRTKKYIKTALSLQKEKKGYNLVEILSQCPTNLGIEPVDNNDIIKETLTKYYKLGIYKNKYNVE